MARQQVSTQQNEFARQTMILAIICNDFSDVALLRMYPNVLREMIPSLHTKELRHPLDRQRNLQKLLTTSLQTILQGLHQDDLTQLGHPQSFTFMQLHHCIWYVPQNGLYNVPISRPYQQRVHFRSSVFIIHGCNKCTHFSPFRTLSGFQLCDSDIKNITMAFTIRINIMHHQARRAAARAMLVSNYARSKWSALLHSDAWSPLLAR